MTALIPLDLGVLGELRPYDALSALSSPYDPIPASVRRTVQARDANRCRFCGFESWKYQEVVALSGSPWDVDGTVTACIFCHQVACLDVVPAMRSGVLVWLPEVPQATLHHMARGIYLWRITSGLRSERARRVLDRVMERRAVAAQRLGSDDLHLFIQKLRSLRQGTPDPGFESALSGLRLFPLDRRIRREMDIEFNQFPGILAFWRSRNGPLSSGDSYPGVAEIEPVFLDAAELAAVAEALAASGARPANPGTPHNVLAARLLRDAAVFFRTLARQNLPIAEEMSRNAEVFEKMAALMEAEPTGLANGEPYASLTARLLREAAAFFRNLAETNEPLRDQMTENASVFDQIANLVQNDPTGLLP